MPYHIKAPKTEVALAPRKTFIINIYAQHMAQSVFDNKLAPNIPTGKVHFNNLPLKSIINSFVWLHEVYMNVFYR